MNAPEITLSTMLSPLIPINVKRTPIVSAWEPPNPHLIGCAAVPILEVRLGYENAGPLVTGSHPARSGDGVSLTLTAMVTKRTWCGIFLRHNPGSSTLGGARE